MKIELTEYETNLAKLFCELFEMYEQETDSCIVKKSTIEMYNKLKKVID